MLRSRRVNIAILLVLSLSACSNSQKEPQQRPQKHTATYAPVIPVVDGGLALQEVKDFVAIGQRVSGTPGASVAASYLAKRLTTFGYTSELDVFTNLTPNGPVIFRNVYAYKPGHSTHSIILASHLDTRSNISDNFVGANDSGSSTGLLLELARIIATAPTSEIGLGFAFFDGEECVNEYGESDGLHGSKRLSSLIALKQPHPFESPKALILLDMIGDQHLHVALPGNTTPELTSLILKAAHAEGVRSSFSLSSAHMIDDHVPFTQIGLPAVDLIDYEYGSEPGLNDYWHTENDTIDKISEESLAIIGRVTLRSIALIQSGGP